MKVIAHVVDGSLTDFACCYSLGFETDESDLFNLLALAEKNGYSVGIEFPKESED